MPPSSAKTRATRATESADPRMVKKLKDLGFFAELNLNVGLQEFDEQASLHNQARLGNPVDPSVVATYTQKLLDGTVFPAIVAWEKDSKDKLLIVDGNHRYQAAKQAGLGAIDVYIIKDADRRKVNMLMMTINTEHGVPTDEKTRIQHAITFHDNGVSLKDAAKILGVSYAKVQEAYKLVEAAQRADANGISRTRFDQLSTGHRKRLNQIHADEVFTAMTKVTIDADLSLEELNRAVRELSNIRLHKDQMAYVDNVRRAFAEQIQVGKLDTEGRGRQKMSPRTNYILSLGRIENLAPPSVVMERLSADDRTDLKGRTKKALEVLNGFYEAL